MHPLINVIAVLSIVLLLLILRSVRRERIRVEHSVSWLIAALTLLALSLAPPLLERARGFLGLSEPAVALLLAAFVVFIGVFYRTSRVISELKDMNITLIQRVAILEYHLRETHEQSR
jgi:hypothetical protein